MTNQNPGQPPAQSSPDISALQAQLAAVQGELEAMHRTEREQRLQSLPADQRPLYQRQMDLEEQQRGVERERQQLQEAAKGIHAHQLSYQTGMPVEELMKHQSRDAMDEAARTYTYGIMNDPVKLRQLADFQDRLNGTGEPTEPPAPGSERKPAGVQSQSGGTSASNPSAGEEVTKKYAGRGAGDMAEWLGEYRRASPIMEYGFDGQPPSAPAALPPQPAPTNQPEPTPAGVGAGESQTP